MNKRQAKKHKKKMQEFTECYVSSYRELKELDRSYHEFQIYCNRKNHNKEKRYDYILGIYLD